MSRPNDRALYPRRGGWVNLPLSAIWLDAAGVGEMLGYEARVISEKFAPRPDFPKPARIGNKGRPRWRADKIAAWMEQWQEPEKAA